MVAGGGGDEGADRPDDPHLEAAAAAEGEDDAALEGPAESRHPADGGALLRAEVAGGELDAEGFNGLEAAEDTGGGVGGERRGDEVVEGGEEGVEEGGEEGGGVIVGGRGEDPVDAEEEGVGEGDEGGEAAGDGAAAEEGLDVGDPVEDEEEDRVG